MTLPLSGLLTMQDINVELGRSANTPCTLNDADLRALAGVPSGPYSMSAFYGKARISVRNLDDSLNDWEPTGTAQAFITYYPDGTCAANSDNFYQPANWLSPTTAGVGSGYYLKFTGAVNYGGLTQNTWYSLTQQRSIGRSLSVNGGGQFNVTVSIATAPSDSAIVATGLLVFSVERG